MKKILFLISVMIATINGFSQTTAQDWTRTDCSGINHHLFADLDSGKVVIMSFDMMYCSTCTSAALYTNQIYQEYLSSHKGKVLMFSMGYTNTTVCADMTKWVSTYGFSFYVIEKCPNELSYYGQEGMPTLVIVGGSSHKVYYKKLGFAPADSGAIKSVIDLALSESSTGINFNTGNISTFNVYPNPAVKSTYVSYTLKTTTDIKIELYNILGEKIKTVKETRQSPGKYLVELNIDQYPNGVYFININNKTLKFIVSKN